MVSCDQCPNVFDGDAAEARGWLIGVRRGNEIVDLCPEHRKADDEGIKDSRMEPSLSRTGLRVCIDGCDPVRVEP